MFFFGFPTNFLIEIEKNIIASDHNVDVTRFEKNLSYLAVVIMSLKRVSKTSCWFTANSHKI